MLNRRTLIASAAVGAAPALIASAPVPTALVPPALVPPAPVPPDRGSLGQYRRLPSLHAEGMLDFLHGMEAYAASAHAAAADARADALLARAGYAPDQTVKTADAVATLAHDPIVATRWTAFLVSQRLKMKVASMAHEPYRAHYLARLDAAATAGPGSLRLDPDFVVPDYARHELHMQPGGYVGTELAGYVFRYGIVGSGPGHYSNEVHVAIAAATPAPADGKVARILDLGCGIGQYARALKARFPQAQVQGVDTSAPMLRYAHLLAVELGADVAYSQQSAEALDFPDDHFDIVVASGLFHEIAPEATRRIIGETARVMRPGATFYPLDLYTATPPGTDAKSRFAGWISSRWYHEDWREGYMSVDFDEALTRAGLEAIPDGPALRLGPHPAPNLMALKAS